MSFDEFLKEVAPYFGLQWRLFQRRGVKRKVERRLAQLGLLDFETYLTRIEGDPSEQVYLSKILTVTISRFFRDREVFDAFEHSVFPEILRNREKADLKVWSIGCASGEEPYSLAILWKERFEKNFPEVRLSILATDIDEKMLRRADEGRYKKSSLREMPEKIIKKYFKQESGAYVLNASVKGGVEFQRHDILGEAPFSGMDIVFCRNLAFTYFSKESQIKVLRKLSSSLNEKGYLVVGKDESLPLVYPTLFVPVLHAQNIYQKFTPFEGPAAMARE